MGLIDFLTPSATRFISGSCSKKRLLQELADIAQPHVKTPTNAIFEALMARENLGPTGVGHGVAIPHARISGLTKMVGCFARLEKPIDFESVDRQPVDLVFALFAPEAAGVEHLKALAQVSRILRAEDVCAKLRANDDPATLHAILCEAPKELAA